jgi:glycosyltransferase involved in cell wall biosynthesis
VSAVRVLQVLEATAGGTRRHLRELVFGLSSGPFELHLACALRRDPDFLQDIELFRQRGVTVELLELRRDLHPIEDLAAQARLRRLILAGGYDLVHAHSAKAGFIARVAALGLGTPIVYSPHAFPFLQAGLVGRLARLAETLLAPGTAFLHAVSSAEGRLAVESGLFEPARVAVVENAADLAIGDRVSTLAPCPSSETTTFGFLGELRDQKAPFVFLEAAALAAARRPRLRFVMPDQGPLLREVKEKVAQVRLGPLVTFVPSRRSLNNLYRRIHVGVLPSRWEGLPYALLDAMALRLPVIASSLPVFQDLLGPIEPRLIFEAGDAASLAARLVEWSDAGVAYRRRVGEAERTRVERWNSPDIWRAGMIELYRRAASTRAVMGPAGAAKCSVDDPVHRRHRAGNFQGSGRRRWR